jgi:cytochrome P450
MFMPFSLGKRSCIGQNLAMLELRVILANIIRNFDFQLVGEPGFDLFVTYKLTDFYLKFFKR